MAYQEHEERHAQTNIDLTFILVFKAKEQERGGFFLAGEDSGRRLDQSIPAYAFFFFFFKWRLARAH